jgi:group II intron reverse transcriptase/maturase
MVQKSKQLELPFPGRGEALRGKRSGQATWAKKGTDRPGTETLMERVVSPSNLKRALRRVKGNGGSPGVDGMTVEELPKRLWSSWERIREELLAGTYQPSSVLRVAIPKRSGGQRELGIPTALDRLIQQALLQVLQPRFDPGFSEHSYGYRPGRNARDAVCVARQAIQDGRRWVVDVDIEKFFDRVHHDVLMGKLERRIGDRRILGLIRRYLNAGILVNGVVMERYEGTPQGGPLSPLLANVYLDEIDQELERRGHHFVRYADDMRVFVGSKRAGERVMDSLVGLFGKLRLRINKSKSAVDKAWKRPLLGFAFWVGPGRKVHIRVSRATLKAMKDRVRSLTRRTRGRSLKVVALDLRTYLVGWKGYFGLAETPRVFSDLDQWIRHRLRAYQLKQWKRGRTVFRELRKRGVAKETAARIAGNTRSWWRNSARMINVAFPNTFFDGIGVPRLAP